MVASIIGRQAPLGATGVDGPVQLRNEVSRNHGSPSQRRRVIGNISTERVHLQEGQDDIYERIPAQRRRQNNGAHRRNIHISGFSPTNNDPSSRFNNIVAGYESMNRLTDAIANSFLPAQQNSTPHTLIDIVRDYHEISTLMQNAPPGTESFYTQALTLLDEEMTEVSSQRTNTRTDESQYDASVDG